VENAPRQRSQEFLPPIPQWVKRGLSLKSRPASSPALNLLEILWRFMQSPWLPFSASTSFARLRRAVAQILKQFGTEYKIDFQTV